MKAQEPVLRPTEDYAAMKQLAVESGLEEGTLTSIIASYGFYDGRELVGCAALKLEKGRYSLECLAVRDRFRYQGLGSRLVVTIEKDARARGAKGLWVLARAPDFFKKMGYRERKRGEEEGPSIASCATCPQYKRNCSPEVLKKEL
jgi:N-acetylglutamate synthase-like GNAT family acetyltransferase